MNSNASDRIEFTVSERTLSDARKRIVSILEAYAENGTAWEYDTHAVPQVKDHVGAVAIWEVTVTARRVSTDG